MVTVRRKHAEGKGEISPQKDSWGRKSIALRKKSNTAKQPSTFQIVKIDQDLRPLAEFLGFASSCLPGRWEWTLPWKVVCALVPGTQPVPGSHALQKCNHVLHPPGNSRSKGWGQNCVGRKENPEIGENFSGIYLFFNHLEDCNYRKYSFCFLIRFRVGCRNHSYSII